MAAAPPSIPDEIFEEILLRLPPDDPACLLRASLVCKAWGCAVSAPGFRRRLHELHRTPPVLGFLHGCDDDRIPHFTPTTASSFSLAAPDSRSWRALDCRHGRALFLSKGDAQELLLWEPTTGAQQRVPVPVAYDVIYRYEEATLAATAAVFCAADGCDHRDCSGGPFGVLFVFCVDEDDGDDQGCVTLTRLYSSETGTWDEQSWIFHDLPMCFTFYSSVLVGRSLLYFMSDDGCILEYDFAGHGLTVFDPPNYESMYDGRYNIMLAEDGGLGVSQEMNPHLKLWTREVIEGADARWVMSRVIYLENLLPDGALIEAASSVDVLGFAEGANVIFVTTVAGVFTIELQSERVRRVCDDHGLCNLIPVVSFYTPVP
uniref:Predicted protein n=1 Tax=Hordeum vulgare subsp. vulgare TaxID=112509 RepID=F2EF96_HORVV|nr:predicted protein [Hordeum vulgare subsp. vulgare]